MTSGPVMIDLGLDRGEPELDRPWAGWSWVRGLRTRHLLAAALSLVLAWPLAGAGAPERPVLIPLWSVPAPPDARDGGLPGGPAPAMVMGERHVYVAAGAGGERALTAYRLRDGAREWRTPLPTDPGGGQILALHDELVLVVGQRASAPSALFQDYTTAYDRDTGQRRWSHVGWPSVAGGQVVLQAMALTDEGTVAHRTVSLDPGTGEVVWSFEAAGQVQVQVDRRRGEPAHLVTLADGTLRRVDPATGAVLASRPLPAPGHAYISHIEGDLVFVTDRSDDGGTVSAHDRESLELMWTHAAYEWVTACGPVLCGMSGHGGLGGLDPDTGAVRWTYDCGGYCSATPVGHAGWLWVAVEGPGLGQPRTRPDTRLAVLDATTGDEVAVLGEWLPAVELGRGRWLLVTQDPRRSGRAGPSAPLLLAAVVGTDLRLRQAAEWELEWWESSGEYLAGWSRRGLDVWRLG